MVPEGCIASWVIAVPILVLTAGQGMDIEDGVDFVPGTLSSLEQLKAIAWLSTYELNNSVHVLEALLLDLEGLHVILEVMVVQRQAQAVKAQRGEELSVLFGEEVL